MNPIITIGAANIDVTATLQGPFEALSNNPSKVSFNYGGSARNVAHNLALLGENVQMVTLFGGDIFGGFLMDNCRKHAIDLHLSERRSGLSTSTYVAMLNPRGDRITAAVDDEALMQITPLYLAERIDEINAAQAVVMSANLPIASMVYLLEQCETTLYINAVSAQRVPLLIEALRRAKEAHVHSLKVSRKDALLSTGKATVEEAAEVLLELGVEYVYITMAEKGVYCRSRELEETFAPYEVDLVNTMGAGDAFIAGIVLAVKNGIPFPKTAQFGLRVAAATIGTEGVVNPNLLNVLREPVSNEPSLRD